MNLKQGDLAPKLTIDLNADVTGATSKVIKMRRIHDTTIVTKTLTVVDAPTGVLEYQWVAPDTDTPGTYLIEAVITFASGAIERFPQRSYLELVIKPKVG
jgi:hypothetical protein